MSKFLWTRYFTVFGGSFWKPILYSVTANKWKSESPVSKTLHACGFISIFKHVGFLVKLVSPFKLQNSSMHLSFVVVLTSPKMKKFCYMLLYSSMIQLRRSIWFGMKLLLELYKPLLNHFRFLNFISRQIDSLLHSYLSLRNFKVISSQIKNIFLSNLYRNVLKEINHQFCFQQ